MTTPPTPLCNRVLKALTQRLGRARSVREAEQLAEA
jgi:hypothetical protein